MTDPVEATPGSIASSQRPKRARATIAELTLIVRPSGNPAAVQAFTAAEAREAQQYAAATGAEVESPRRHLIDAPVVVLTGRHGHHHRI